VVGEGDAEQAAHGGESSRRAREEGEERETARAAGVDGEGDDPAAPTHPHAEEVGGREDQRTCDEERRGEPQVGAAGKTTTKRRSS